MLGIYGELFDPPFLFLSHGSPYGRVKVFYGFILLFYHYVYTFIVYILCDVSLFTVPV